MSSPWRMRSASVANTPSRRFFSRMTFWDCWRSAQRLGSLARFSTSASCSRSLPASKVLPEITDFVLQRGVFLFQFFDHFFLLRSSRRSHAAYSLHARHCKQRLYSDFEVRFLRRRASTATAEIIAHKYANRSP